ncbi:uncharacterized protein LOC110463767 [Mizuhopecten yessoensis]|uniref:Uncharacterized protein n=1 Tax=Mizuhopecten yessoensis TaxID=6573 RepID=A0A210PVC0_MIZYE|nr:uncharacterized protein LOC110463767 [Mizuhopecten yessoensis]XP_021374293.1 uncharacterized protein LOC110463767 [Mizuhopecten yessoensis]XP_021374294.1 uncharacterized protein LOC110463767 [Mizuhopecten yessoensis]OWF40437.1 hypothetical protein KP79_PYT20842 [Mizuhopecten yessoensis]
MESNHLWTMLVSVALSLLVVGAQENIIPVIRNDIPECQENAVCANVFRTNSLTRGYQVRSILNCRCHVDDGMPGSEDLVAGGCPYLTPNDNNSVFQSQRNQEVFCGSVRDLPMCEEGQLAREKMSDFSGRAYFAVYCRCPFHTLPFEMENRMKATVADRFFKTRYTCNQRP